VQCLIGNGVVLALDALVKEANALVGNGVPVFERLKVSPGCPLILPSHVALDLAREKARGASAIGTTGRGIGPAYEDKVSRRALRVSDLFLREKFAAKLGEILDYHNFLLKNYFRAEPVDFAKTLDEAMQGAEIIAPITADVTQILGDLAASGENILFEGAQGTFLDIDHGTYPFVTSSNTVAAAASTGTGIGPRNLDYVLGIVKAYTTRVGAGPVPTELFDDKGAHLAEVGAEFSRSRSATRSMASRFPGCPSSSIVSRNANRFTRNIPGGRRRPSVSPNSETCLPMRRNTCSVSRNWPGCPSTSFPPVRIANRRSSSSIRSGKAETSATSGPQ
jgi:adenylosuccinate synthase